MFDSRSQGYYTRANRLERLVNARDNILAANNKPIEELNDMIDFLHSEWEKGDLRKDLDDALAERIKYQNAAELRESNMRLNFYKEETALKDELAQRNEQLLKLSSSSACRHPIPTPAPRRTFRQGWTLGLFGGVIATLLGFFLASLLPPLP